jgi:hypothetical protein
MDIKKNSYYFDIHSYIFFIKSINPQILISFYKFAKNYYYEFHMEYTYKIAFW